MAAVENGRGVRPRARRRPERSHNEIYDRFNEVERLARAAASATDQQALVLQRVETSLTALVKAVGKENEDSHGRAAGTGLVGKLMRLEHRVDRRFRLYDGWKQLAIGFCAAVVPLAIVIWWLAGDRLALVLK